MTNTSNSTITLNKGGIGEKEIKISALVIPDLWHVATRLREAEQINDAQLVIDCWYLAHAMKDHLQALEDPEPAERAPEPVINAIANIIRKAHENYTDHAPIIDIEKDIAALILDDEKRSNFERICHNRYPSNLAP